VVVTQTLGEPNGRLYQGLDSKLAEIKLHMLAASQMVHKTRFVRAMLRADASLTAWRCARALLSSTCSPLLGCALGQYSAYIIVGSRLQNFSKQAVFEDVPWTGSLAIHASPRASLQSQAYMMPEGVEFSVQGR
jgi:hypothetical protein